MACAPQLQIPTEADIDPSSMIDLLKDTTQAPSLQKTETSDGLTFSDLLTDATYDGSLLTAHAQSPTSWPMYAENVQSFPNKNTEVISGVTEGYNQGYELGYWGQGQGYNQGYWNQDQGYYQGYVTQGQMQDQGNGGQGQVYGQCYGGQGYVYEGQGYLDQGQSNDLSYGQYYGQYDAHQPTDN